MADQRILLGVVGKPHGVRGLVRLASYASAPEVLAAHVLHDERGGRWRVTWRGEGIAALTGIDGRAVADRDAAAALTNLRLYVDRAALPPPGEDEFYLADLVGLAACDGAGHSLGIVAAVHDYGAGASLELDTGALVPFTRAAVPSIDLARGRLTVAELDEIEIHDERPASDQPALDERTGEHAA